MDEVTVTTTAGGETVIKDSAIAAYTSHLRGDLLGPRDGAYDDTRRVWNGMIDRRPGLISRPTGAADVIATVIRDRGNDDDV